MHNHAAVSALYFTVAGHIVPACTYITRTSAYDSGRLFTFPWKCRDPTKKETISMLAFGNNVSDVSSTYDPIGVSGGCMPDATCVDGRSQWTNIYGYAVIICIYVCLWNNPLRCQIQRLLWRFIRFSLQFLRNWQARCSICTSDQFQL